MIQIGERKYEVKPPPAMRSFALQQRILPVAGRVANVLLQLLGVSDVAKLADMDVMSVLPAAMPHIGAIFSEMPHGELEAITRELLKGATCDKLPLFDAPSGGDPFDTLMQGRALETWQLLWHALEVWYPDFFGRARSVLARAMTKANPSAESSTSETSGQATVS